MGTCSLYQLKTKDVLDELDSSIITQTKEQTWKRSTRLSDAILTPLSTLRQMSFDLKSPSEITMTVSKYVSSIFVSIMVLFFVLRNKKIKVSLSGCN